MIPGAPSSTNTVMLIPLAKGNLCVSLLLLSGGSKLEFEALLNSSKALKPVLDRSATNPAFGLVDGSPLTALLTGFGK